RADARVRVGVQAQRPGTDARARAGHADEIAEPERSNPRTEPTDAEAEQAVGLTANSAGRSTGRRSEPEDAGGAVAGTQRATVNAGGRAARAVRVSELDTNRLRCRVAVTGGRTT